jgi:hypothetical protein
MTDLTELFEDMFFLLAMALPWSAAWFVAGVVSVI